MKTKKKGNQQKRKLVMEKRNSGTNNLKNNEETNPFELRINKVKHSVIGQKIKSAMGNPGASKNRINKIRLKQLKKASELRSKSNIFMDKRIGEYDNTLSMEDRINARMVHARKKKCKKNIFNLNDDEPLTHLGEDILNLEEFDRPGSDSDDEDHVQLSADFVEKAHFGGGFLTKKVESDAPKTHKEIIGDIILESKQKKEEKKAEKRENEELGERLDKQWKEMQSLFTQMKRKDTDSCPNKESYDMIVRELKFEPRGTAASALKSDELVKKEEEQKRIQMEKERRLRMMNPSHLKKKQTLSEISVDRLDYYDGFKSRTSDKQPAKAEESQSESETADEKEDESDDEDEQSENGKQAAVKAKKQQPSHNVPQTVDEFLELIKDGSADDISLKLKSLIDSLHPSLRSGNKALLEEFYSVMAKYLCLYRKEFVNLEILDMLVGYLYDFGQMSSVKLGTCFRDLVSKKFISYRKKKAMKASPTYDVLLTLKLCSLLFSTSDFQHPVVTPAMLLMSVILTKPYRITPHNVLARLFLSNLFFEYVAYSKRLATEPILFLQDIFYLALSEQTSSAFVPRHNVLVRKKAFLFVGSSVTSEPSPISMKVFNPSNRIENTDELKVSIIFTATKLLQKFANLYDSDCMFDVIFSPFLRFIEHLPISGYPSKLAEAIAQLKSMINEHSTTLTYLTFRNKKPPMLKMLEPKFDMNFGDEKKVTPKNKLKVEKRLQQKIKKEERGLIRTVRQEAQFAAGEQLKTQRLADEERRMKVKRLCQELSMQEGEFKKLCKKK